MKTFIHIGQPKTGTTSIQHFLQAHRKELLKQKIFVPNGILDDRSPSHYLLNVYALDNDRYSLKKEQLLKDHGRDYIEDIRFSIPKSIGETYKVAKDEGAEVVLWSNEGLYFLNSQSEYNRLVNLFLPYSDGVSVICCWRDIQSLRKSYMSEIKKNNLPFAREKHSYRYVDEDSWLWDVHGKKKLLESVFHQCLYFDYHVKDNLPAFFGSMGAELPTYTAKRLNITPKKWWKRFFNR